MQPSSLLISDQPYLVISFGELALLVDERHEVERADGDEVERLLVVDELDVVPVDGLVVVLLLLHLEDVLDEELLQVLVGVVDAELLERVGAEVFEAEDVKHADGCLVLSADAVRLGDGRIDLSDDVDEEASVDSLGEGISDVL